MGVWALCTKVACVLTSMLALGSCVSVNSDGLDRISTSEDIVLKKNGLTAVFATRLAGACYFLEWNGHVIIPELEGNGGSLQTALAFDIPVGESPEVENPTEAGSVQDNYGRTSSDWMKAAVSQDEVYTKTRMAYWVSPGDPVSSSKLGTKGRGSSPISDVIMRKRVSIEDDDVMRYRIRLQWDERHWFTQVQLLAVYLARDFDTLYVCDNGRPIQKNLRSFSSSPPDEARPIIVAKSRDAAVGLVALRAPEGTYARETMPWYVASFTGGHKDFGEGLREVDLTAISAVWHGGSQLDDSLDIPRKVSFEIALVFGSVQSVAEKIHDLQRRDDRRRA